MRLALEITRSSAFPRPAHMTRIFSNLLVKRKALHSASTLILTNEQQISILVNPVTLADIRHVGSLQSLHIDSAEPAITGLAQRICLSLAT
jgi:hypothetical protein